ncbi:hypothetical protein GCM10008935_28100 [Alkalibacillus silvisoli]|uniref:Uncharacterized protein n=1 Tax=Alkalibacillus silvisoli TaxID=392823 RepID=A0ABP3K4G5_9BACI
MEAQSKLVLEGKALEMVLAHLFEQQSLVGGSSSDSTDGIGEFIEEMMEEERAFLENTLSKLRQVSGAGQEDE